MQGKKKQNAKSPRRGGWSFQNGELRGSKEGSSKWKKTFNVFSCIAGFLRFFQFLQAETKNMFGYILILLIGFLDNASAVLNQHNQKISWMTGKWRSEFSGKIFWPTVPTMTFGEELTILEAPMAKSNSAQFLNFRQVSFISEIMADFHVKNFFKLFKNKTLQCSSLVAFH